MVDPQSADVGAQLERILLAPVFADCERSQQFLRYVVEETLAGRAGRIKGVTIANEVFGFDDPEHAQNSTVVRVEAGRLRRRLDQYYSLEGSEDPIRITIRKGSYVPSFETNPAAKYQEGDRSATALPKRSRWLNSRSRLLVGLLVLVIVGIVVWTTLMPRGQSEPPTFGISAPSIAVLPFEDLTADASGVELAAGLTDDIITDLSRLSEIDVISLSSVQAYHVRKSTPTQVGRELNVSHVLFGHVRGSSDHWRVTAQLYETQSGTQVWAQRFDHALPNDVLDLQDELAVKIVDGMSVGIGSGKHFPLERVPTENMAAYSLYKQALDLVNPPNDIGRLLSARRAFERVIELDPLYAGGYAGAAYTHAFMAFWGRSTSPEDDVSRAFELSARALELDSSFGLAFSTKAFAHQVRRDYSEALAASAKAIEVAPNDPYVSAYHAAVLLSSGAAGDGIPYAKRALRLDPLNPRTPYLNILGMANFHAGNYQDALIAFKRNIERDGPFGAHIQVYVTATYAHLGRMDEAIEHLEALGMYRDGFSWEEWIHRWMKESEEAERVLSQIRELAEER